MLTHQSRQIPNPLFDLAGITCGYFMIPFGTFALATFLGKAVIKAGIQVLYTRIPISSLTPLRGSRPLSSSSSPETI